MSDYSRHTSLASCWSLKLRFHWRFEIPSAFCAVYLNWILTCMVSEVWWALFNSKEFSAFATISSLNKLPVLQSIRWVMAKRKMQLRHSKKSDNGRTNSVINPACFTWLSKNPNQRLRRLSLLKGCLVDAPEQSADLKRTPETQVIQRCQREDAGKETSPDTLLEPKIRASRSNWCLQYVTAGWQPRIAGNSIRQKVWQ